MSAKAAAFTIATVVIAAGPARAAASPRGPRPAAGRARAAVPFVESEGEGGARLYCARTFVGQVTIERGGAITYRTGSGGHGMARLREVTERPFGALACEVRGIAPSATALSVFRGNDPTAWRSRVPCFDAVSLGSPWPGISITVTARADNIEKVFRVLPGADAASIKWHVEGVDRLEVAPDGLLVLHTARGPLPFTAPIAYQEGPHGRTRVPVAYSVSSSSYGFTVGEFDPSRELVIDPLIAATLIGSDELDDLGSIAFDQSGNVIVAGYSAGYDFPITPGALPATGGYFNDDVIIAKFDPTLSTLLAATYIGTGHDDHANDVTVDASGNIIIVGYARYATYPTTPGCIDPTGQSPINYYNVVVSKFSPDLTTLLASTYLGGSSQAYAVGLAANGDIYVAGKAGDSDMPLTPGAYDSTRNGMDDGFVARLNSSLTAIVQNTLLGAYYEDVIRDLVVDASGRVWVTGHTDNGDFPTTAGAYDTTPQGHHTSADGFVARFDANLTTLQASTVIGEAFEDQCWCMSLAPDGTVAVAGFTENADFPATVGAFDTVYGGNNDAFVATFDNSLSTLLAASFVGGLEEDEAFGCLITSDAVYVCGTTQSADFPVVVGSFDTTTNIFGTGYISKFSRDLTLLEASTYYGTTVGTDTCNAIALDGDGNIVVCGRAAGDIPVAGTPYDPTGQSGTDAFVAIFDLDLSAGIAPTADASNTTPTTGASPLSVTLDGTASTDADNNISGYTWSVGGQTIGTGATYVHEFLNTGSSALDYTVALTVTDDTGFTSSTTVQISVDPPVDTDGDGLPDYWETQYVSLGFDSTGTDESALNYDADGLTNLEEYQNQTDPGVDDTDSDGMPDDWEVDNSLDPLVDDATADADGDGIDNETERALGTDPQSTDSDSDGLPDAWEYLYFDALTPTVLNPASNDSDGDGTLDGQEDDDDDGATNSAENIGGSDPLDPASLPPAPAGGGGGVSCVPGEGTGLAAGVLVLLAAWAVRLRRE